MKLLLLVFFVCLIPPLLILGGTLVGLEERIMRWEPYLTLAWAISIPLFMSSLLTFATFCKRPEDYCL